MPLDDRIDVRDTALRHAVNLFHPTMTGGRSPIATEVVEIAKVFEKFLTGELEDA